MRNLILILPVLALCACSDDSRTPEADAAGSDSEIESGSVLDKLSSPTPRAGQWEMTANVIDVKMPGMPDNMKQMMIDAMGPRPTFKICLTEEDAKADPEKLWRETNGDCSYETFSVVGGKMSAVAVCKQDGGSMRMTMSGTQDAEHFTTRNEMQMKTPQGDGVMIVEGEGRRTGDCDGTEIH